VWQSAVSIMICSNKADYTSNYTILNSIETILQNTVLYQKALTIFLEAAK